MKIPLAAGRLATGFAFEIVAHQIRLFDVTSDAGVRGSLIGW
jgi:hypothetical protein